MSCALTLCLGLVYATQADDAASVSDTLKAGQSDRGKSGQGAGESQMNEKEGGRLTDGKTIKGEVMRAEYGDHFVKRPDGKEVRLHTDKNTQMMGQIKKGDRIDAKVNDQNHVLSIRSAQ